MPARNVDRNVGGYWFHGLMNRMTEHLTDARRAVAFAGEGLRFLDELSDQELLQATGMAEEIARHTDVIRSRFAARLAERSRPEFGNAGLAAQQGFVNPESLVRSVTRTSFKDAARRIRVGVMLNEAQASPGGVFAPIAASVAQGELGIEAADCVLHALKPVADEVDPRDLRLAAETLAREGARQNADDLGTMARGVRDTLDRMGVRDREEHLRGQRSLRKGRVIDGLRRVTLVLDPESDAIVMGAIDHAMSPRLGGPSFTGPIDQERAARLVQDDRTNEQLALDTLVELVRIGVDRDDGSILGSIKPAVRVTVALDDLTRAIDLLGRESSDDDTAVAWLEGCSEPLTAATARRILCDVGALPVVLGRENEPLDLGRTRRLFSRPQRIGLAIRDGGCRWPQCDRPPSWCEAHHIDPYGPGGRTDVGKGVLLCRRHHMLLHNNGWRVERGAGSELVLIPPASVDPEQTPRAMPTKRPNWVGLGERNGLSERLVSRRRTG